MDILNIHPVNDNIQTVLGRLNNSEQESVTKFGHNKHLMLLFHLYSITEQNAITESQGSVYNLLLGGSCEWGFLGGGQCSLERGHHVKCSLQVKVMGWIIFSILKSMLLLK